MRIAGNEARDVDVATEQVLGVNEPLTHAVVDVQSRRLIGRAPVAMPHEEVRLVAEFGDLRVTTGTRRSLSSALGEIRPSKAPNASTDDRISAIDCVYRTNAGLPLCSRRTGSSIVEGTARESPSGSTRPVTITSPSRASNAFPTPTQVGSTTHPVVREKDDVMTSRGVPR